MALKPTIKGLDRVNYNHAIQQNLAWSLAGHTIDTHFLPDTDSARDSGSASYAWRNTYSDRVIAGAGTYTNPSFAFSSNNGTGFYSTSGSEISVTVGTSYTWAMTSQIMGGKSSGTSAFRYRSPSVTSPNILPAWSDDNTGIGGNGNDQLSLIAGGVEALRATATGIEVYDVLNMNDNEITNIEWIDFNLTPTLTHQEGRMHWDADNGTVSIGMPGGNVELQVGQEGLIHVRNTSGSTIGNGKLVYTVGSSGNKPLIGLADNSDADKIHILGMTTEEIDNNDNGYVALWGKVRGETAQAIDTDGLAVGTKLYLSTAGGFTATHPSGPTTAVIVIGEVDREHATEGVVLITTMSYFTIGNNFNGTMRQSIINKSTGTSAAAGFTAVNNLGHFTTIGIAGSNNSVFPNESSVHYAPGYGDHLQAVDGNKDFVWYTDPTDSHNNSSLTNEVMRLEADGTLGVGRLEIEGKNIIPYISHPLSGVSEQQQSLYTVVSGGNIYMDTEIVGGGDIQYFFDEEEYDLDCTTGAGTSGRARVQLTEGTATVPQINYVYVHLVGGVATLAASTTVPTGEFCWHSIISVQDDATVTAEGPINLQRTTEALQHNGRGQLSYIREKLRWLGPRYVSGCGQTLSGTDPVNLEIATGEVFQLHRQTFPALSVVTNGITVCNASGVGTLAIMENIHDLNDFDEIEDGTAISNNKWFSGTVWATMASSDQTGNQSKLFLNLPTAQYNSESEAIADSSNFDVRTAPTLFNNTAFLVCRVVFKKVAGDNVIVGAYSLLGSPMGSQGGGGGSTGVTSFDDSTFKIYDDGDDTKIIDFQASGITTANTRTITMADEDVNLQTLQDHYNSTGVDHTYIDQDVTANASPEFDDATINGDISGETKIFALTVLDPNATQDLTNEVFIAWTHTAITITKIQVEVDTTDDIDADLKYADSFQALDNSSVIDVIDTTSGKFSATVSEAVASGKAIYLSFDGAPSATPKQYHLQITYTID